jgi:hypothetical protein
MLPSIHQEPRQADEDPEKLTSIVENGPSTLPKFDVPNEYEDNSRVPQLSVLRIFWFFFTKFGLFAWGGPVAQIALIKDRLVIKEQWITLPRFNRVFAVYQILPGPEAAELCMFFGCLAGGRWGGLAAGLGFILPGFVLMLAASYVYVVVGFGNTYFDASFRALQPMVAAMVDHSLSISANPTKCFVLVRSCVPHTRLPNMLSSHTKLTNLAYGSSHMPSSQRLTAL